MGMKDDRGTETIRLWRPISAVVAANLLEQKRIYPDTIEPEDLFTAYPKEKYEWLVEQFQRRRPYSGRGLWWAYHTPRFRRNLAVVRHRPNESNGPCLFLIFTTIAGKVLFLGEETLLLYLMDDSYKEEIRQQFNEQERNLTGVFNSVMQTTQVLALIDHIAVDDCENIVLI